MSNASTLEELMFESNFTILRGQTSVYSVTSIKSKVSNVKQLLVALLKGKLLLCSYKKIGSSVRREDKSISFRFINNDANIISIHSFTCKKRGITIGITYYKDIGEKSLYYFNVYWNNHPPLAHSDGWDLETIAQSCQQTEIKFLPYQLAHCKIPLHSGDQHTEKQTIFVLLGSDCKVHQYIFSPQNGSYIEPKNKKYLVELKDKYDEIPTYIDFKSTADYKRITAIGFQSGLVIVYVTDTSSNNCLYFTSTTQHDSPIVKVALFATMPNISKSSPEPCKVLSQPGVHSKNSSEVHLLVVSAWEDAVVYSSVAEHQFDKQVVLAQSSRFDIPTCCTVADVDQNGENDIMLGTYGQELIVYKFTKRTINKAAWFLIASIIMTNQPLALKQGQDLIALCNIDDDVKEIHPSWSRSFSYPVINVIYLDMIADGLEELVVITAKGIHVFQYNMEDTLKQLKTRLKEVMERIKKEANPLTNS